MICADFLANAYGDGSGPEVLLRSSLRRLCLSSYFPPTFRSKNAESRYSLGFCVISTYSETPR